MKWKNKVNRFFDSLFYSERDNNKNLDGKVYVESTEDGAVVLGSISTRKIITDQTIVFSLIVNNQILSEAKFIKCPNGRAGKLICQTQYKIKDVSPVLIYEHSDCDLDYSNSY